MAVFTVSPHTQPNSLYLLLMVHRTRVSSPACRVLRTLYNLRIVGWGQPAYNEDPCEVLVILCLCLISFGIQLTISASMTYVVDCHRDLAGEASLPWVLV
jgi:hypothetical protein